MTTLEICLIDLIIIIFLIRNPQIAVAENRYQTDFTGLLINAGDHLHIGKGAFFQIAVTGIHTEHRNGPVAVIPEMTVQKQTCEQAYHQDQDFTKMFFLPAFSARSFVSVIGTILSHIALTVPPSGIFLLFFTLGDGAV